MHQIRATRVYETGSSALLSYPSGVVADPSGNLYIADDGNCRVRKVTASTGTITTFAGNGTGCFNTGGNDSGDGGPATNAQLGGTEGVALDSAGNLYIACGNTIRKVTALTSIISTVAGSYIHGYSGDGGPATSAVLNYPAAVAVDSAGNLYIADTGNNIIRKVTFSTGIINTVAGNGIAGYSGDGVAATSTELYDPTGVALDGAGNIYIVDAGNSRIRKVTVSTGLISTVAGNGNYGFSGDGGVATTAELDSPGGVTLDSAGNLYIADSFNNRIRKVTAATGIITTIAGNGILGYSGDGGLAIGAELDFPETVALNSAGDLYIADEYNGRIRAVGPIATTATVWDSGTVSLLVNNSPLAIATYGEGSTSATVAAALATSAAAATNPPVKVTAVDDALYLEATAAGVAGNAISYSLQNTAYTSSEFTAPSFPAAAGSGTLAGGDAQGANGGQVVYQYNAQFDSANNLISDNDPKVMGNWLFQYDALNRLVSATDNETGNPNTDYCWGYDPFGNRTIQAGSSAAFPVGSPTCTPAGTASYSGAWANYSTASNNQLANTSQAPGGVTYDASGDVVNDGVNQYLYDAEGRVCAVAYTQVTGETTMTGYVYNASGERVSKGAIATLSCDPAISGFTATNDYVLGPGGEQVTEMALAANNTMAWQHTNVFAAGNLFATYDNNGLHFYFNDVVGTRRMQTDYAGVVEQHCSGLPFGDSLDCSNSIQSPTEHHFTGKERDVESGLDYFGARYYASSVGRFMSPDWASHPEGVPYASFSNPQSLNLYAYVGNNPLGRIDADGHEGPDCPQGGCSRFMSSEWAGALAQAFPSGVPAMLMYQQPAQQQSGSSGGSGFGSHVGNLLHGHSWNYGMRESVTVKVDTDPNGYVTAATDAAGVAGLAASEKVAKLLGRLGAAASIMNDPRPQNIMTNVLGLFPGFDGPMAITGAFNDFLDWGANNSTPGPYKVGGGQDLYPELQTQDGGCESAGLPSC